ncbi:MAG: radical SAM protein [Clostridia bacterium]|nr:radical SAM protein [Clostridia bacterium]
MRHINLPIFIPHLGCPNDCVFCNQRKISGTMCFNKTGVKNEIDTFLDTVDRDKCEVQLAFFGGSFTGIDRDDMLYLLGIAKEYIDRGLISSVRLSTRPDYINAEILDILAAHGVKSIELGIQSMSDKVLSACKRGHTADISKQACRMIKERGFELIGQMMTALPCSTPEDELNTALNLVSLGVDGARIYPTMVFSGTELEKIFKQGDYAPPTLDELIERTANVFSVFAKQGIPVIRIGLQASDGLGEADGIVAGAYEAAMGEMVISRYYMNLIIPLLDQIKDKVTGKELIIYCAKGEISKVIGHKQANKMKILSEYNVKKLKILEKEELMVYNISIDYN